MSNKLEVLINEMEKNKIYNGEHLNGKKEWLHCDY